MATSAAAAATAGGFGIGGSLLSYGLNRAEASRQHDRNKNYLTRKYQYELIALNEAGINPAYMFSDPSQPVRAGEAPRPSPTPPPNMNAAVQAAMIPKQIANLEANTNATNALAEKHTADAEAARAAAGRSGAAQTLDASRAKRIELELDEFKANPGLLRRQLEAAGQSPTNVGALQRALDDLFRGDASAGAYGVAGAASVLALTPFMRAILSKNWKQAGKIGFAAATKAGVSRQALLRSSITLLKRAGLVGAGVTIAQILYEMDQSSNRTPGSGSGRNRANRRLVVDQELPNAR